MSIRPRSEVKREEREVRMVRILAVDIGRSSAAPADHKRAPERSHGSPIAPSLEEARLMLSLDTYDGSTRVGLRQMPLIQSASGWRLSERAQAVSEMIYFYPVMIVYGKALWRP